MKENRHNRSPRKTKRQLRRILTESINRLIQLGCITILCPGPDDPESTCTNCLVIKELRKIRDEI